MKNTVVVVLAALFLVIQRPRHGRQERVVQYDAVRLLGRLQGDVPFELSIKRGPFNQRLSKQEIKEFTKKRFWGTDGGLPDYSIESLSLRVDGKEIEIPRKAYSDLYNINLPSGLWIMESSNGIHLYISGGDAAGSYEGKLIVKNNKVVAREIEEFAADGTLTRTREEL